MPLLPISNQVSWVDYYRDNKLYCSRAIEMARVHSGDGFTLTLPIHVLLASSKLARMVFVPGVDEQDFLLPSVRGTTLLLLVELLRCGKSESTGRIGSREMTSLDEIQQVMEVLQIEGYVGMMRVKNNLIKHCEKDNSESHSFEGEGEVPSSSSEPLEPISNLETIIPRHKYHTSNGDSDVAYQSDIKPDIVEKVTEKKNFQRKCHVCGKDFTKKSTLIAHIRHNHSDALFPCTDCSKKFILKHTLELHVQAIHKGNASCNYCPNSYKNAKALWLHIRNCHRDKMSPCTKCNKSFILPESLKYHMETFHSKGLFVCEACHATFDKRKKLEAHVRHVHSGIRHVSQKCKATFSTKESLKRHTRNKHGKESVVDKIADHEDVSRSDHEETEGNDLDQASNMNMDMNIELQELHFDSDLL